MDYSNSLLLRLEEDATSLSSSLSSSSASSSLPLARDLATRKLLAATPVALDALLEVSRSGDDKDRVAAASKILSFSPAVDSNQAPASSSLPVEALTSIVSALTSFAKAALASSDLIPVSEPVFARKIDPEPILAPSRKNRQPAIAAKTAKKSKQ